MLNERLEKAAGELVLLSRTLNYFQNEFFMMKADVDKIALDFDSAQAMLGVIAEGIGRVSNELIEISDQMGE